MPTYEYQCSQCQHYLTAFQKITDEPLKLCPKCGESQLQKRISASAFQLKGTGWYQTDFRDKDKPQKKADDGKKNNQTTTE
jgi:putative FmdB family regulatory protein